LCKKHLSTSCDVASKLIALTLRFSLNQEAAAQRIEAAVKKVLEQGFRTADIYSEGTTRVSTKEMGEAVLNALA
jgi:3-isopropylmalate dehydrogenase